MNYYDIIRAPLLSERAYSTMAGGKYTFWVHPNASKTQVKNAIQQAFGVKVVAVNILNVRGKEKRVGRFVGQRSSRKKAIITLVNGQKIEALEGLV